MNFSKKNVLVTGGTGLIGKPLVERLLSKDAVVRIVSLDDVSRAHPEAEFLKLDLTNFENCKKVVSGMDYVFNLVGVKSSPKTDNTKPASYFVPTLMFDTNMMEAARREGVKGYLFTSTVGVYTPAEIFHEDDVWKTFPLEKGKFQAWSKRIGELQAEAYAIEYGWNNISIVRPTNVYGPYDNFDSENSMVVPSLIKRVTDGENPLIVWGDGSQVRDFVFSEDVADCMIAVAEKGIIKPINIGSGRGYSIRELVDTILKSADDKPQVVYDTSKPSGDKIRIMDISRATSLLGWQPKTSLEEGIKKTMRWYESNKEVAGKRYDVFNR